MAQLPYQWPVDLFRRSLRIDVRKGVSTAIRSFHASSAQLADNQDSNEKPTNSSGRISKSRTAFRELKNLQPKRAGLRGGQFGGAFGGSREGIAASASKPPGAPLIRRTVIDNAGQGSPPAGMVMARRRAPLAAAGSDRGGAAQRGRNQGVARRGNRRRRGGAAARSDSATAMDDFEEFDDDDFDGADGGMMDELPEDGDVLSDLMVRHLRQVHEDIKGDVPYSPETPRSEKLLALTKTSLPPLPNATPDSKMKEYLENTTPQSWEPGFWSITNPTSRDIGRLIKGLPVRLQSSGKQQFMAQQAEKPKFASLRTREASQMEADGLKPSKEIKFAPVPAQLRKETEERVLAGKYPMEPAKEDANDKERLRVAALRGVQGNPSYQLKNEHAFMNIVDGLLSGNMQVKAPRTGKT